MKLLFFTYDFPYPTNSGGKTRAYNLLKERAKNIDVTLFSFTRPGFDKDNIEGLKKIGITDIHLFPRKKLMSLSNISVVIDPKNSIFQKLYFNKEIELVIHEAIKDKKINTIHFESFYTGFYISKTITDLGVRQIFGTENIEANIYEDYIKYSVSPLFQPLYRRESKKIRREEDAMMKIADLSLAVTPSEKEYIEVVAKKKAFVIENGVDLNTFTFHQKEMTESKTILFVGNFSYFPNTDAIDFFYHGVFKKIENSNLRLTIVGKGSTKLEFTKDPRVTVHEYVEDIVETYKKANVFVSPIRIGGGTNFKILESMAVGLPVIAFPHRLQDLGVVNKKHLLIAHNEKTFIDCLNEVFDNKALARDITKNARELIEEKFSWKSIGQKMNKIWLG
jgi:polysaccharide biosynthesis protein PslH